MWGKLMFEAYQIKSAITVLVLLLLTSCATYIETARLSKTKDSENAVG